MIREASNILGLRIFVDPVVMLCRKSDTLTTLGCAERTPVGKTKAMRRQSGAAWVPESIWFVFQPCYSFAHCCFDFSPALSSVPRTSPNLYFTAGSLPDNT